MPVIVSVPAGAFGVNVTVQETVAPVPPSVQLAAGVKLPDPVLVKLTVPVGVVGTAFVSVTATVQLDAWLITTVDGVQVTVVVVA